MKNIKILAINPYETIQYYENRPMEEARFFKAHDCNVETILMERKMAGKKVTANKIADINTLHFICKDDKLISRLSKSKIGNGLKKVVYFGWYVRFILWLRKYLRSEKPDSLICHNIEMALAGVWAGRKKVDNIVFVMREMYEGQSTRALKNRVIKLVSGYVQNRSDFLVHVVPKQMEYTSEKNRNKVIYIPNYPKEEIYSKIVHKESVMIRINYIGSVRDVKSLKMLMDAAQGLKGIKIGIHGMGEAYEELKSIEHAYKNVDITGYYNYAEDTEKLFADTDIIYCAYNIEVPNWRAAYPIKLYEAIATGIPVILCKGMAPERFVISNGCGFVFDYNVDSLRALLSEIVEKKELLLEKQKGVQNLKGEYTWNKVVQEYLKILK